MTPEQDAEYHKARMENERTRRYVLKIAEAAVREFRQAVIEMRRNPMPLSGLCFGGIHDDGKPTDAGLRVSNASTR